MTPRRTLLAGLALLVSLLGGGLGVGVVAVLAQLDGSGPAWPAVGLGAAALVVFPLALLALAGRRQAVVGGLLLLWVALPPMSVVVVQAG